MPPRHATGRHDYLENISRKSTFRAKALCRWPSFVNFYSICFFYAIPEADNEERSRQMKNLEDLQRELVQMKRKLNDASSMCIQLDCRIGQHTYTGENWQWLMVLE